MKLLWASDDLRMPTGYACVSRNLLHRFRMCGIDAHHLSFHIPHPHMAVPSTVPVHFPIWYPVNFSELYGNMDSVPTHVGREKPDVMALLGDSFMFKWLMSDKTVDGKQIKRWQELKGFVKKSLFYFPFDSNDVYEGAKDVIETFDIKVAMSQFGHDLLKRETSLESYIIPHGVDTNVFRPFPEYVIERLKKENKFEGKFIVGTVCRNQSRKLIDMTFRAFAEFSKDKPEAILLAHTDPKDQQGYDLVTLAKKLGIEKKVFYTLQNMNMGKTEPEINALYNLMDIHVLTTTGEGFGIPLIEAMSAGTPNLATDYTTPKEILDGNGELGKVDGYFTGSMLTQRAFANLEDIIAKMNKLYSDPTLREKYGRSGRERAIRVYDWQIVVRQWLDLFDKENLW